MRVRRANGKRAHAASWQQLTAADVMQPDIVTVAMDTPIADVERILTENRITGVPVTDARGVVTGVLSLRDIVGHFTEEPEAQPGNPAGFYGFEAGELEDEELSIEIPVESGETAGSVMTREVLSVDVDTPLRQVAKSMVEHAVHRLLVVDRGRTAGIVSTTDLLRAAAR